jgi:hypothetical protein
MLALKKALHDGEYRPGQRLPSVRSLAEQFGLDRNVVHYALRHLVLAGLIFSRAGSGYYVNSKIRPGFFHRIAYILNDVNPMFCGQTTDGVFQVAYGYGFEPVMLCNYWSRESISKMLEQDSNFDGMVINGYNVTDKFLDSLARFKIPYMVFGYRDISARHPQLNSDGAVEDVRKKLCSIFLDKLRGRRMACLTGHGNNLSDRVALEGFRLAAADCGIITAPELICRCNNDGYYEFKRLYENERIEAVLLYGDPLHGYLRYFQEYPDKAAERPYCLVSSSVWREEAFALLPKLFDKIIFSSGRDMAIETTKKLFARILPADE